MQTCRLGCVCVLSILVHPNKLISSLFFCLCDTSTIKLFFYLHTIYSSSGITVSGCLLCGLVVAVFFKLSLKLAGAKVTNV